MSTQAGLKKRFPPKVVLFFIFFGGGLFGLLVVFVFRMRFKILPLKLILEEIT